MLTHGIRALFLAQASITALAPAQTVGRISFPCVFCESPPEGVVPPYVVIKHVGTDPLMTLDSTYHESGQRDTVEVDSVGHTEPDAKTLNKTIRQYFDDYSGNVTAGGITDEIKAVTWEDENYDYDYPQDGSDKKVHTYTTTYTILQKQGS